MSEEISDPRPLIVQAMKPPQFIVVAQPPKEPTEPTVTWSKVFEAQTVVEAINQSPWPVEQIIRVEKV